MPGWCRPRSPACRSCATGSWCAAATSSDKRRCRRRLRCGTFSPPKGRRSIRPLLSGPSAMRRRDARSAGLNPGSRRPALERNYFSEIRSPPIAREASNPRRDALQAEDNTLKSSIGSACRQSRRTPKPQAAVSALDVLRPIDVLDRASELLSRGADREAHARAADRERVGAALEDELPTPTRYADDEAGATDLEGNPPCSGRGRCGRQAQPGDEGHRSRENVLATLVAMSTPFDNDVVRIQSDRPCGT